MMFIRRKRFASLIKQGPRAKRTRDRDKLRLLCHTSSNVTSTRTEPGTPISTELEASTDHQLQTAMVGEQLNSDYYVHELPTCDESTNDSCSATINAALLARIEILEAENTKLKLQSKERKYFRIECVEDDDNLVCFYAGFVSYRIFLAFFDFLGPAVSQLHYWGSREGDCQ